MAASIREQIIDAAMTALNGPTRPVGLPQADRLRMEPYQLADMPAINVMSLREEVQPMQDGRWGPLLERAFTLRVVCYVAGAPADQAIDPLAVWIEQSLSSPYLGKAFGGLAQDCYLSLMEWQYADDDQNYAAALMDFRVTYQTSRSDPTTNTQ